MRGGGGGGGGANARTGSARRTRTPVGHGLPNSLEDTVKWVECGKTQCVTPWGFSSRSEKKKVIANHVSNIRVKDKRAIFHLLRITPGITHDSLLPVYGFIVGEFAIWQVLKDSARKHARAPRGPGGGATPGFDDTGAGMDTASPRVPTPGDAGTMDCPLGTRGPVPSDVHGSASPMGERAPGGDPRGETRGGMRLRSRPRGKRSRRPSDLEPDSGASGTVATLATGDGPTVVAGVESTAGGTGAADDAGGRGSDSGCNADGHWSSDSMTNGKNITSASARTPGVGVIRVIGVVGVVSVTEAPGATGAPVVTGAPSVNAARAGTGGAAGSGNIEVGGGNGRKKGEAKACGKAPGGLATGNAEGDRRECDEGAGVKPQGNGARGGTKLLVEGQRGGYGARPARGGAWKDLTKRK